MTEYKSKLGNLADRLRTETPNTPIQEVQPVKVQPTEVIQESRFNNWIPSKLKKRLKQFAAEKEISLKDITIEALKMYLAHHRVLLDPEEQNQ